MTMELLHAYRFGVTIQNTMMGFQELSGIAREIEVETYQEGGRNDAVLLFPKRTAAQGTITLKKGVYSGQSHPFYLVGEQLDSMKINYSCWFPPDNYSREQQARRTRLRVHLATATRFKSPVA